VIDLVQIVKNILLLKKEKERKRKKEIQGLI